MTSQAWLQQAIIRLHESDNPRHDAKILLGHVTGQARTQILAFGETTLFVDEATTLEALLQRRQYGKPIAHLVGQRESWPLPLFVSPATLTPRPDTECLVEQALAWLPAASCYILGLSARTGAITLALASEHPDCEITAVDVMPDVMVLALRNTTRLGIADVTIRQSGWFSALAGQRFTMIVSNPPYIDTANPCLAEGDARFEPLTALAATDQGLADLAQTIHEGRQYLLPGGWMLLKHDWTQGEAVRVLFHEAGYLGVATCRDYDGNEHLTLGRLPDMRNVG